MAKLNWHKIREPMRQQDRLRLDTTANRKWRKQQNKFYSKLQAFRKELAKKKKVQQRLNNSNQGNSKPIYNNWRFKLKQPIQTKWGFGNKQVSSNSNKDKQGSPSDETGDSARQPQRPREWVLKVSSKR